MADLRFRYIEDYAGGLLNISRQEISTTGEVLSQDGFTTEGTIFVEDGSGVKSGLKLGVSLAEVVDPTTESGIVNVRYGDRTYAKVRDLKIFTTAIASAQSALSEATSVSISNLETAFQLLEDDINSLEENLQGNISNEREKIQELTINQNNLTDRVNTHDVDLGNILSKITFLENSLGSETNLIGISEKITSLEQELDIINTSTVNLETSVGNIEDIINTSIDSEIIALKTRTTNLETSVGNIETLIDEGGNISLTSLKTDLTFITDTTNANVDSDIIRSIIFKGADGSQYLESAKIYAEVDDPSGAGSVSGALHFAVTRTSEVDSTVRYRIDNLGAHAFVGEESVIFSKSEQAAGTTVAVFVGQHSSTGVTDGTNSVIIYNNGNAYNDQGVWSTLSDINLKENIENAASQWDDIKSLRVVNYNFKKNTGKTTIRQIGFIAQEVEQISPGLVESVIDSDKEIKGVKTSVISIKAIKALQEAMKRIEELEAKVALLEGSN